MPQLSPSQAKNRLALRRSAPLPSTRPQSSATTSLLQKILPRRIVNTLSYARNNPARAAAHALPFGLGALMGLSSEAELSARNKALMIARARDASRNSIKSPLQVFSSAPRPEPYRPPYARPAAQTLGKPRIVKMRTPPPLSSRPVARGNMTFADGVRSLTQKNSISALARDAPVPRKWYTYRKPESKNAV